MLFKDICSSSAILSQATIKFQLINKSKNLEFFSLVCLCVWTITLSFPFLLMIYCSLVRPRENPPLIGFSSLLLQRNNEIVIYLEPEPVSVQEHKYKCKYKVKYKNKYKYKKHKKWVKTEKFTPLAKILHCRRHWRDGQIPPLTTSFYAFLCGRTNTITMSAQGRWWR